MKFRFDDQPHQAAATSAVTDLFEAALLPPLNNPAGQAPGSAGHGAFRLDEELLSDNLGVVSQREGVPEQTALDLLEATDLAGVVRTFPNFSVEMETGTGKTYVYISTALRLAELYGLRKFVIVVHSIAIRAGVIKTFEQTAEHFAAKYPGTPYTWGALGDGPALDDFTEPSSSVRFLVVSVQAIDKPETNTVYQEAEQPQLWGAPMSGIAAIAATRPVVILDEPQNMATELRRRAIATLNPLVALRYSATHRDAFNLIHRLGPKQANDLGLVKRVSVKGVVAGISGEPYLLVKKLRSVRRRLTAEVVVNEARRNGVKRTEMTLQAADDLEELTGLSEYHGLVVDEIGRKPDHVVFENGRVAPVGEEFGVDQEATWADELRHTIRQHLARQDQLDAAGREVKVLSLFFVERVADYVGDGALLPTLFDKLFLEEWARAGKPAHTCPDPAELRTAYFASTKTGITKDTNGRADEAAMESRAYAEIIANKELILTRTNPRAFIFSHSALREGWDNPNVFQVCFLRHTRSELERRQQIGRGLRLPVDETGRRVMDPGVCRLTLIVDESFAEFREGLNREYAAAAGIGGGGEEDPPEPDNADDEVVVRRRPKEFESPEFKELWKRIRYRARYRVSLDGLTLPAAVASSEHLDDIKYIGVRANMIQTAELQYDDTGKATTDDAAVSVARGTAIDIVGRRLPNLLQLVEDQLLATKYPLQLSRPTLTSVLEALPDSTKRRSIYDPDRWARVVADAIRVSAIEEMVSHIGYEPLPEDEWWDAEVVFLETEAAPAGATLSDNESQRGVATAAVDGPNLYDHTIYDSHVERSFAAQLESNGEVKLFTKLPRRFRVRTPVGEYSPDWAVVVHEGGVERVYLIRETKATLNLNDLEWSEAMRIRFAYRHFKAAPAGVVDYEHTTAQEGLRIKTS